MKPAIYICAVFAAASGTFFLITHKEAYAINWALFFCTCYILIALNKIIEK